jgi:hypothetical protein
LFQVSAADAERDVRGFALKFYTEGNWDLVGNSCQKSQFPYRTPQRKLQSTIGEKYGRKD